VCATLVKFIDLNAQMIYPEHCLSKGFSAMGFIQHNLYSERGPAKGYIWRGELEQPSWRRVEESGDSLYIREIFLPN
jgi:hypothetical protein